MRNLFQIICTTWIYWDLDAEIERCYICEHSPAEGPNKECPPWCRESIGGVDISIFFWVARWTRQLMISMSGKDIILD